MKSYICDSKTCYNFCKKRKVKSCMNCLILSGEIIFDDKGLKYTSYLVRIIGFFDNMISLIFRKDKELK